MDLVQFTNNQAPYLNAENLNNNFNELEQLINEKIPTGVINIYAGDVAPTGWLICDGSAISRTEYADLFDVIGTTYGAGDNLTTFNLPNLKSRIPVGLDSNDTDFDTLGNTGGEKEHALIINEIPQHSHSMLTGSNINSDSNSNRIMMGYQGGTTEGTIRNTQNTGGGAAHNILQPYIVLNYIISY